MEAKRATLEQFARMFKNLAEVRDPRDEKDDDPNKQTPERPIAKATSRNKSPAVYCGRYYVDSTGVDQKFSEMNKKLMDLKLKDGKFEESSQLLFEDRHHPSESQQVFCVGSGSGHNFSGTKTTKGKYSTKPRKSGATKNGHSLRNISLNPTNNTEEIPVAKRMETKARLKQLREDDKEVMQDIIALRSNPKADCLSNDVQAGNKSLGFSKYRASPHDSKVPKSKKKKHLRKRYLTVPLLVCTDTEIAALTKCLESSISGEQDKTRDTLLPLGTEDGKAMQAGICTSRGQILHNTECIIGVAGVMNEPIGYIKQESGKGTGTKMFTESDEQREIDATQFREIGIVEKLIASFKEFSINQSLFFYPQHHIGRPVIFTIERGFNPSSLFFRNNVPFHYQTLLHAVTSLRHLNLVKYLIEKRGAEVDAVDCCGRTPLMLSLATPSIIQYLIGAGANVNHQDKKGMSALMLMALTNCPMETLSYLLQAGADPLAYDVHMRGVVYYALSSCKPNLLQTVLDSAPFLPNSRLGQLTFAGIPLFIHQAISHSPALSSLLNFSRLPDNLKLSVIYLNAVSPVDLATMNVSNMEYKSFYSRLTEALKQKARMNVTIDYPVLSSLYGGRKEVETTEELEKLCCNGDGVPCSSKKLELAFQCFIITERITGYTSYNSLVYFKWIVLFLFGAIPEHQPQDYGFQLSEHELYRSFFKHFANMLLHHVKMAGSEKLTGKCLLEALSMTDALKDNPKYKVEIFKVLQEAVLVYLRHASTLHHHSDSDETFDCCNLAVTLLNKLQNSHAIGLISTFVAECPKLRFGRHFQSILTRTIRVDKFLALAVIEHSDIHLLNMPDTTGEFPLHLAGKDPDLVKSLLEHGAHPDVVNPATSQTPLHCIGDRSSMAGQILYRASLPSSLSCLAANLLVSNSFRFPYQKIDLPPHIKNFISLHDKLCSKHMYTLMEEYGFTNHNFTIKVV